MPTIRVVEPDATPWMVGSKNAERGDGMAGLVEQLDPNAPAARFFHPGSDTELQAFEMRLGPGYELPPHAHLEDEIIYVLAGTLELGARTLRPGASVYIPAETLYALRAGPEGLRFLNMRARQDLSFFTKEEFLARRAQRATS